MLGVVRGALWITEKHPILSVMVMLFVILMVFLMAASKNDALGGSVFSWLDARFHVEYLVGVIDVGALIVAVGSMWAQEQQRKKDMEDILKSNAASVVSQRQLYNG
jgi:hypothetical protein